MTPPPNSAGTAGSARHAVTIDRLRLRAAGLDEAAAETLARLVAVRLTPGLVRQPGAAGAAPGARNVSIRVAAQAGDAPEDLAERVAAAIATALARGTSGVDAGGLP